MTSRPFALLIVLTGFALGYSAGSRASQALRGAGRMHQGVSRSVAAFGSTVALGDRGTPPEEGPERFDAGCGGGRCDAGPAGPTCRGPEAMIR